MVINVHAGHNPDGKVGSGASGIIKESTEARKVKDKVIAGLQGLGHTVYDCTIDNGTSQSDVLKKIVAKCNAHKADLDVSIHFNSGRNDYVGDGSVGGTEVFCINTTTKAVPYAQKIVKEISKLGFRIRDDALKDDIKTSTSLYYLKNTKAPAVLVECCFVDDKDDIAIYNAESMAQAIIKGITGESAPIKSAETKPVTSKPATSTPKINIPIFKIGKTYVLNTELKVRTGAGTNFPAKNHSKLTTSGKAHDRDKDGALDKGTKITCQEVKVVGSDIWVRCPSGWIAGYYKGKKYID